MKEPTIFERKWCKWCGAELERGRRCLSQWKEVETCSKVCASQWRWHRCAQTDVPVPEEKHCLHCGELLVRRNNEQHSNFAKRDTCNKNCASSYVQGKKRDMKAKSSCEAEVKAMGVKIYTPGTPGFAEIAALYGG